jgi:hypothetical protein
MDIKLNNNINNRNLIIFDYEDKKEVESFIKKNNLSNWRLTFDDIWKIYYGKIYNPPFFNNIIVLKKKLDDESLQYIWNMIVLNGYILINIKYKDYYSNSLKNNIRLIKNNNKVLIKKNVIKTYFPKKYRVVDFIIAGSKKGGTTAGISNLSMHPDISMVKHEISYYSIIDHFQKGKKWYMSHFDYRKKRVGDKAPDVMYQDGCLQLLQHTNPHVKIILFLRNPIERAYSDWKMTKERFNNKNSFEYCILDEYKYRMKEPKLYNVSFFSSFIRRGFYYEQIQEILKYFSKENLLILISEKIRKNMDEEYQKIFSFLELPEYHANFVEEFQSLSPDDVLDKKNKIYLFLKKIYEDDVKQLEKFLGYKTEWW